MKWLPLILGLALGLRLSLAYADPFNFPDSADYDALARTIVHAAPYQVGGNIATRMPGYPIMVAGVYAITGTSHKAVLALQALMGGAIVYLTYIIGRQLAGESAALIAAALAALDPLSIGFSAALLSETPFTVMLLLAVLICLRLINTPPHRRWRGWLILGLIWGIAVYLRASALWCILPLGLVVASLQQKQRDKFLALAATVVAIAIVFLLLMPWQLRDYQHFHDHYLRLTTLEGTSLYEAVFPGADGGPKQDVIPLPPEMLTLNEAQRNDEWSRRAWNDIAADPLRIARLALKKMARTWSPFFNAGQFQNPLLQTAMGAWYIPSFILALIGLFTPMIPQRIKMLLLVPILYFTAVHALFLGSVRYRVPLMPLVYIFAAAAIVFLAQKFTTLKPIPQQMV